MQGEGRGVPVGHPPEETLHHFVGLPLQLGEDARGDATLRKLQGEHLGGGAGGVVARGEQLPRHRRLHVHHHQLSADTLHRQLDLLLLNSVCEGGGEAKHPGAAGGGGAIRANAGGHRRRKWGAGLAQLKSKLAVRMLLEHMVDLQMNAKG